MIHLHLQRLVRSFTIGVVCLMGGSSLIHAQASPLDALPDCGFVPLDDDSGMRVGAVLYEFESGAGCVQGLDTVFNVASIPKIFVAGAYYDWLVQGLVSLSAPLIFTRDYYMGGQNDCLREADIGNRFDGRELIEKMINCSDNASTWMLMDAVGWQTVNNYIQTFGIVGIGEVLPYSEVDRLKLSFVDERWLDVPRGLASRYFRGGMTSGLEQYFTEVPARRLTREEEYIANSGYFLLYDANTVTPRALADYFISLRAALLTDPNSQRGIVARLLFNTLLYTQRLNSVQALPGTVLVGGKNGFDRGIVAEANLVFDATTRIPTGMVIVFTQQSRLDVQDVQPPSAFRGSLNTYVRDLSPVIAQILYPDATLPPLMTDLRLSGILLQSQDNIQQCWEPYFASDFAEDRVDALESCFASYTNRAVFNNGENAAFGLTLRDLMGMDARFVFVFTAPDGTLASYQTDRAYKDKTAVYWYHPVEQAGNWTLDIYLNSQRIARQSFVVQ